MRRRADRGTWEARWRDPSGAQRRRGFRTRALADRFLVRVESDLQSGSYVDLAAGKVTLLAYARSWATAQPHAPATARRVESNIRCHLEPEAIGRMAISAIRPSDVQAWVTGRSKVLSPGSVRLVVKLLRSVLLAAAEDGLIARTPAARVSLPSPERPPVKPLTVRQVQAIADAIQPRMRAMVVAQAGLGLRLGELLGLRVQDVDWLRRVVRVEGQSRRHDRVRAKTKTARGTRTVPLPSVVGEALSAHLAAFPPGEDGTLFVNRAGRPWAHEHYGTRHFGKAAARAGVEASTHALRHHYVSLLLDQGASVVEVAEIIGDTPAMVLGVYGHLMPGREDRARRAVDDSWRVPTVSQGEGSSG